jgi:hypothetical protein
MVLDCRRLSSMLSPRTEGAYAWERTPRRCRACVHEAETPDTAKRAPIAPRASARGDSEEMEGRGLAKGNTAEQTRTGRSAGVARPSALDRVREAAAGKKRVRFTAL